MMTNLKNEINPDDLTSGTIEHYRYYVSEYKRVKVLTENVTGDLADELYMELDGIIMALEDYEP